MSTLLSVNSLNQRNDLDQAQLHWLMHKALKHGKLSWENLNFWDKASLFSIWEVVGFIGNLFTIFGTLFYLLSNQFKYSDAELLLGFGIFLIWIKTIRFFDGTHPYDLMIKTAAIAWPTFIRVLIGVAPFIIGTGFLTVTIFWQSHDLYRSYASS